METGVVHRFQLLEAVPGLAGHSFTLDPATLPKPGVQFATVGTAMETGVDFRSDTKEKTNTYQPNV